MLAGSKPGSQPSGPRGRREPLDQAEARVLRCYLPAKLSAPEIAGELYLSVNTVKTHMRHLYDKLGAPSPRVGGTGPSSRIAGIAPRCDGPDRPAAEANHPAG